MLASNSTLGAAAVAAVRGGAAANPAGTPPKVPRVASLSARKTSRTLGKVHRHTR